MASKYKALTNYLKAQPKAAQTVTLSFDEMHAILGSPLPRSASTHRPWWGNQNPPHPQTSGWLDAGFKVDQVNVSSGSVRFVRT